MRLGLVLTVFAASCGTQFSDPIQRLTDEAPGR